MSKENTLVAIEQGGKKLVVKSGGEIEVQAGATLDLQNGAVINTEVPSGSTLAVKSGGALNVESGGALKIAGTDKTAAVAAAVTTPVAGVAASYKVARGTLTPDADTKTVVTGLTTVVAVVASLDGNPVDNCQAVSASIGDQAGSPAAGSIVIKTWKATAADNTALVAATTPWVKVSWIAIGT